MGISGVVVVYHCNNMLICWRIAHFSKSAETNGLNDFCDKWSNKYSEICKYGIEAGADPSN